MNFIRCQDLFIRADKIQAIHKDWDDETTIYLDKKLQVTVHIPAEELIKMIDELESKDDRTTKTDRTDR